MTRDRARRSAASGPVPRLREQVGSGRMHGRALNSVQRQGTASNCTHQDLQVLVFAGQSRCRVLLHTTALNGSEQQSTALYVAW